jgi:hypothetical protein
MLQLTLKKEFQGRRMKGAAIELANDFQNLNGILRMLVMRSCVM